MQLSSRLSRRVQWMFYCIYIKSCLYQTCQFSNQKIGLLEKVAWVCLRQNFLIGDMF